jgi:hypothetical protein
MTLHEDWSSKSSGRSKRACIACHTGKIKCDGKENCSRCTKRGIECSYPPPSDTDLEEVSPQESSALDIPQVKPPSSDLENVDESAWQVMPSRDPPYLGVPQPERSVQLNQWPAGGIIDLMQMQIRIESPVGKSIQDIQDDNQDNYLFDPNGYLDLYYRHFDHRWPIVHRFSADDPAVGEESELMVSAMKMVGAWIEGSDNAKSVAKRMHYGMMDNLMSRLVS